MSSEVYFGRLSGRQLHLMFWVPSSMEFYENGQFKFSWWRLLNPSCWWRAFKCRGNWELSWNRHENSNHRCYRPIGNVCDGSIAVCGFRMNWWYSNYTGENPCWCDKVMKQLDEEDQCEPSHSC